MKPVKIAVIGASGYTGLELLRLLLNHPHAELVCVTSRQNADAVSVSCFQDSVELLLPS